MERELTSRLANRKEYAIPLKFSKTLASLQLILIHLAFLSKIMNLVRKNGDTANQAPQKAQNKIQKAQKVTGDPILITVSPFVLFVCVFCG
jgi:hypothetical protein